MVLVTCSPFCSSWMGGCNERFPCDPAIDLLPTQKIHYESNRILPCMLRRTETDADEKWWHSERSKNNLYNETEV